MINPSILKKYDIRGIYPTDIDEDAAYAIARAFADFLAEKEKKSAGELKVIIGRDMRESSPQMHAAYMRGLAASGVRIFDAGMIAVDQMYFALGAYDYDGGAMITASHNPKEYNGLKMYRRGVEMLSAEDIQAIGVAAASYLPVPDEAVEVRAEKVNFDKEYADAICSFVDIEKIKPMKIVLDAGNGMAGRTFPLILERLPQIEHSLMYFDPDGAFPNHEPNPEKLENTRELQERVVAEGAGLGAAFDGDADRIVLVDDRGEVLRGDIITGIFARHFLEKHPGASIVYNVLCTGAVKDVIEENGGVAVRWKTGHTFMKQKMREMEAVFGGEMSGHLFFKDFYYAESSPLALLIMLEILSESGKKLSELADDLRRYAFWSRYIYLDEGETTDAAIERVRVQYASAASSVEDIDGYTFFFSAPHSSSEESHPSDPSPSEEGHLSDPPPSKGGQGGVESPRWWFNIRPSNTEPRIALTLESSDPLFTEKAKKDILSITGGTVAGE